MITLFTLGTFWLCIIFLFFLVYSEKSAGNNQNPASQHWADSAQKTETSREDMTKYLAQWFHKKMTWADLCAVASAAADLLDWLADRMWIEQKTRSDLWKIFGGKIEIFQKQSVTQRQPETTRTLCFFWKIRSDLLLESRSGESEAVPAETFA